MRLEIATSDYLTSQDIDTEVPIDTLLISVVRAFDLTRSDFEYFSLGAINAVGMNIDYIDPEREAETNLIVYGLEEGNIVAQTIIGVDADPADLAVLDAIIESITLDSQ